MSVDSARGQLNTGKLKLQISLSPLAPDNLVSRDRFVRPSRAVGVTSSKRLVGNIIINCQDRNKKDCQDYTLHLSRCRDTNKKDTHTQSVLAVYNTSSALVITNYKLQILTALI